MECSCCGGPKGVLGVLGNLVHLLCRDCGMQSSIPFDELDPEIQEAIRNPEEE
jgi:hypothetical protein